ncbi:MAG: helix-turn-helix transcriptional regulator, partial [Desulfobulbaceae bacterium]|nr:helix-turn-helix transcriptional regulator [Desulfobulbaceae bacterium]
MPDKDIKIGERIRGLRRAKKLSIADVAEQSGIAESTIASIESHMI